MSVNVLGTRRVRAIARASRQPVVWAFVWSHHDSGRTARITTADHRHGWFDRITGSWDPDPTPAPAWFAGAGLPVPEPLPLNCTSSCRLLFVEPDRAYIETRAAALRAGVVLAGVPWPDEPAVITAPHWPTDFADYPTWPPAERPPGWLGAWPPACGMCGHRHAGAPCAGHVWRDSCALSADRHCPEPTS